MALGSNYRKKKSNKPLALQLTSLLDMFTIILVFLLVSFQAEDQDFVLDESVQLPMSTAKNSFKPAVNVSVNKTRIAVEGASVFELTEGDLEDKAYLEGIPAVSEAVEEAWNDPERKREPGEEKVIVIQAEKTIPYRTLNALMRSAGQAGFVRYRLVVEKG